MILYLRLSRAFCNIKSVEVLEFFPSSLFHGKSWKVWSFKLLKLYDAVMEMESIRITL